MDSGFNTNDEFSLFWKNPGRPEFKGTTLLPFPSSLVPSHGDWGPETASDLFQGHEAGVCGHHMSTNEKPNREMERKRKERGEGEAETMGCRCCAPSHQDPETKEPRPPSSAWQPAGGKQSQQGPACPGCTQPAGKSEVTTASDPSLVLAARSFSGRRTKPWPARKSASCPLSYCSTDDSFPP